MFESIKEVKQANKELGHHFFDSDTMNFFASSVETTLYKNQTFITSEKKCFDDYTRVYSVRLVKPNGSIDTIERGLPSLKDARKVAKSFKDNV